MSEPQVYPVYFDSDSVDEEKLKKIRNYFQIQRKSGGGDCSKITNCSDRVYRVDFKDKQAQQRVLARCEHKLDVGGSSLVITVRDGPGSSTAASPTSSAAPRLRSSGSASSLTSGGEEHEVKVDSYLLQYLADCAQAKNELDGALQPLQSSARLHPDKETALVRGVVTFEDAEAASDWRTKVEAVFDEIKKRYVCHLECEGELRSLLLKSCGACQDEQDVRVYSEAGLAVVVGTPADVKARLEHAAHSHVRVHGASLGQRQSRKRRIDKMKYHLVQNEVEQSLAKDVPSLQMTEAEEGEFVFEGTGEEIRKAYEIIEEKEKTVKESTVSDISRHFLTFLVKVYSSGQRLSDFLGCGESVTIEFKPTKMRIFSLSDRAIEQTVKALKEKFKEMHVEVPNCLEVPVELRKSLKSRGKIMNEKGHRVSIDFTKNTVILVGHDKEVRSLHGVVTKHILDESNIEDTVVVPFPELARKLPELLMLNGFDFAGVTFNPLQSGVVALEGPSSAVAQVKSSLGPFLQSLVRESVIVKLPGALRYSKTPNGGEKLLAVASSHKCLIQLEDVAAESEQEEVVARYFLRQGVQLIVYLGDITKQEADALVNAANEDLRHSGGVALALSKAAGPEVQRESSDLVKRDGKVATGDVVMTSGGRLKCKKLLHAVGPEKDKAGGREREVLKKTVESALVLAESMDFGSIALPCISSGVFGVNTDVCAEAIVSAVKAFGAMGGRSLAKITLIDNRREVVQALRAQCDRLLRDEAAGDTEGPGSLETGATAGGSGGSVRVEIVQGTIENQQVDCLVCPMLGCDPMSTRLGQALQSVAGAVLLTKFNQSFGGATQPGGTVLLEGVPGLLSKAVVFLHLIKYISQTQENAKRLLRQSIRSALLTCERKGFSSVTFPVTGSGGILQFPQNVAALVLLQEIQAFEQGRAVRRTPFQIRIVIHPNDKEASKAFQAAQQNVHLKGFTNDANPDHASFYRHVSSDNNEVTALMGSVKLQVVQGDIIHEKTDVIVNSTGFKSEPAGVSKAILTAAGPNVQAELKRAGDPADRICSTTAGLLGCKEIVHVQTERETQAINKTCKKVLKLCESKGSTSVAFPAINTGIGNMDYSTAGKAMLDGMASAITEIKPKCLSLIRIVILQQPVFDAFKTELENRFGQVAPPQNWKGKLKKKIFPKSKSSRSGVTIPPTTPQPAVFSAIGSSSAAIAALKTALEGLVQGQLMEREFELGDLCRLDEMEVAAVQANARSLGVSFDHSVRRNTSTAQSATKNQANSGDKIVILRGLKEDVLMVAELVNKAIKKALSDDLLERQKQDVAQSVQWMYQKGGEDWEHFDLDQNFLLETAFEKKQVFIKIEFKGNKLKVNFTALDATDSKTGDRYRVKRCETDTDIDFPGHWSPMAGENFKKVEVDPSSKEYQDIAKGFHKTAKCKIHKIERVQNYHLWCSYFVMRRKMEMKNGAAELGEKYLYHGTSAESCQCIERDRFDRNYTGAQGANYGTGVYFAINADYSANSFFSKPDSAGLKRMYVARVLTGRHTLGDSSMKTPPQRGSDPSDKYDSLVDNLQNPSMYVIFHDDQAYPEYLIIFS